MTYHRLLDSEHESVTTLQNVGGYYQRTRTLLKANTVGCDTMNDAATNRCYNEQFLSIKSGCYNKSGGILFIMESSIIVYAFYVPYIVYAFC